MKTVLVPLDGSALSEHVLPYVAYLARTLAARVRLLRVVPNGSPNVLVPQDAAVLDMVAASAFVARAEGPPLATLRRHAEGDQTSAVLALRAHGLDVEQDVEVGDPADLILEAARSASLIAMATHGYGGVRRWALGSVTDKVIQAAPVPVFVVRSAARAERAARRLELRRVRRVLVPLDGSPLAQQALPHAIELAAASRAHLILLRALPLAVPIEQPPALLSDERSRGPGHDYLEASARAFAELQALAGQLQQRHGVVVACNVRPGAAAEAIIEEAEQQDVDLVVMATHGYGGLRRWALGSVADKVLHGCQTPLLLVRAT